MEKTKFFSEKSALNNHLRCLLIPLFLVVCFPSAQSQDWMQLGNDIPGETVDDKSGASISLSEDGLTLAIGVPQHGSGNTGTVKVYTYSGTEWALKGNPITGSSTDRYFGISVSLSNDGNRLAVCAAYNNTNPNEEVKIYQWNGSAWEQLGNTLLWQSLSVYHGSVKLNGSGDTVAIGDMGNTTNGNNAGQIRIYTLNGNTWQQRGSSINGSANDVTGEILDLSNDGNTFAANFGDNIQVYSWNGTDWTAKGNLFNEFPYQTVALGQDGNILVLTGLNAPGANENKGAAQVYEWNGSIWTPKGPLFEGEPNSGLGFSAALNQNNNVLALGGPGANSGYGEARTYIFNGTQWEQIGNTIVGETNLEYCGFSISLNGAGNILAVGSPTYLAGNYGLSARTRVFGNDDILSTKTEKSFILKSHPNPTRGSFSILLDKTYSEVLITVHNTLGQVLSENKYEATNQITHEITGAAGVYLVRVNTAGEGSSTLRIIKQ